MDCNAATGYRRCAFGRWGPAEGATYRGTARPRSLNIFAFLQIHLNFLRFGTQGRRAPSSRPFFRRMQDVLLIFEFRNQHGNGFQCWRIDDAQAQN